MELSVTSAPNLGREEVGGVWQNKAGGIGYQLIIILWVELYPCPPVGLNSTNFRNKKAALKMRAALVELVHNTIITGY